MFPISIVNQYGNIAVSKKSIIKVQSNVASATLVLYDSGELYGWGTNSQYTLGTGSNTPVTTPTLLMTNVKDVWGGIQDTLVLTNDNKMYCAGSGYLFDASNTFRTSWTDVSSYFSDIGITNIKKIDISASCLAVLDNFTSLWVCGYNANGAYTTTSGSRYSVPTRWLTPCYDMKGNGNFGLFTLRSDSKIYAAGSNVSYQLGSTASPQAGSVLISPYYTFTYPATSLDNVLYTSRLGSFLNNSTVLNYTDDRIRISGSNNSGLLSINSTSVGPYSGFSSSSTLPTGVSASKILQGYSSNGNYVSPMLRTSEGLYVCGYGSYGSLGNGSTANVLAYTRNSALDSIVDDYNKLSIVCQGFYSTFLVYENRLYGCGGGLASDINTELPGYSTIQTNYVPISLPLDS